MPDPLTGIYTAAEHERHHHSKVLENALVALHTVHCPAVPVVDYGCGTGRYVRAFRKKKVQAVGVEGLRVPGTDAEMIIERDLGTPVEVWPGQSRFAISLEVAEHIPPQHESQFLTNVCRDAVAVALSWAVRGQRGRGHVNCRDNFEVIDLMEKRGFHLALACTRAVRDLVREDAKRRCPWFANTFLFFLRP